MFVILSTFDCRVQHYIHHPEHHHVLYIVILINFKKKMTRGLPWVKVSKVMPQPQVHFPWEREGSLMAKSPNLLAKTWYGLTVHIHF